jgi:serine/threonine-protein kinase HipA
MDSTIFVFADWAGLPEPMRLGELHSTRANGGDRFDFEYDPRALLDPLLNSMIDPRIQPFQGRQYPSERNGTFGVFADASPDRWGRLLMKRRHEREKRTGGLPNSSRLFESDFLLGVHDMYRVGGIRLKTSETGPFLDDHHDMAAPPLAQLRELEEATRRFELGEDVSANGRDWLRMLIAPGGSLGGARPKASVIDPQNALWIAKFPSTTDEYDVGGWEMVTNVLANACGLRVALGRAEKFASDYHCFLVKRFDRTDIGERLHFASAMTMTGHMDGDDHSTGASYLEIAQVLMQHGANVDADLKELWMRIVFNMLVGNTDDHLRNHGFILHPGQGWRLSDAYDMNPTPYSDGLKLNVSEHDNALDLDLALSVASIFRIKAVDAAKIISAMQAVISSKWRIAAGLFKLGAAEIDYMAPAFRLAES